jgi:hypothetical protein
MPIERRSLRVESLVLDPDNPRFFELKQLKGRKSLKEQDLMEEIGKDTEIITLMKAIRRVGVKDPIWVKTLSGGKYLVIEGNRRTYILRKLLEEKVESPDGVRYDVVDANIFGPETSDTELLLQRVRLQAGKRIWGPFNEALATYELRFTHAMEEEDVAEELQIPIREVRERVENVALFTDYVKQTGDANPRRFSYFTDMPRRVREWIGESPKNRSKYFELISPKDGFQRIRSVATKGGLRDFALLLDSPKAFKAFLKDDEMTVEEAVEIVKEHDITKEMPFIKKLGAFAAQLTSLTDDQIKRLESEEPIIRNLKRLKHACDGILEKLGKESE